MDKKELATIAIIISIVSILICVLLLFSLHYCFSSNTHLHNEHAVLLEKIQGVNSRISDIYIWFGFFVTLIAGAFAISYVNANHIAKKQAVDEMDRLQNIISKLENKALELEKKYSEIDAQFNEYEKLKNK